MRLNRPDLTRFSRLIVAATLVGSCTTPTDPTPVGSITLLPSVDSVEVGGTYDNWLVTIMDANGNTLTGRSKSWESSSPAVATIDASSGLLTGVSGGSTLVTVRSGGKTAQATIKVLLPVVSIVTSPDSFDLPMTTTRTIAVQLVGPGGVALTNRAITWLSNNPGIAVVSASGVVTPVAPGTATVAIQAGQLVKNIKVRVVAEPVVSVRILPAQSVQVIRLGQAKQLTAECLNAAQLVLTGRTITWNSSNPLVASVALNNGLVTGVSIGQAQVTATCDNVSAQVVAQVTPVPVSSVVITPPLVSLQVGQQGQLTATARDSANNVLSLAGRTIDWTSDNLPVATVSSQGVVSAVSAGTAHIQVSVDGIVSQVVNATVTSVPVATVTIEPLNPSVVCGNQVQLSAVMRDANGNQLGGRAVTWQSAAPAVATIGAATGVATGIGTGTSQITATSEGVNGFSVLTVTPKPVGPC